MTNKRIFHSKQTLISVDVIFILEHCTMQIESNARLSAFESNLFRLFFIIFFFLSILINTIASASLNKKQQQKMKFPI